MDPMRRLSDAEVRMVEDALLDMSDAEVDAVRLNASLEWDARLVAAGEVAERKARARDADHAAFHGLERVRSVKVEARRGHRGQYVCPDCYYAPMGRSWPG